MSEKIFTIKVTMKSGRVFTTKERENHSCWVADLEKEDMRYVFVSGLILPKNQIECIEVLDPAHEELKKLSEKVC